MEGFLKNSNEHLFTLHNEFQQYLKCENALEMACDRVWTTLHRNDPIAFPSGYRGTSIGTLTTRVLHQSLNYIYIVLSVTTILLLTMKMKAIV